MGAAGVGYVLAIDDDAWIAAHLVVEAGVDEIGHGARATRLGAAGNAAASEAGTFDLRLNLLGGEIHAGWVEVLGVDMAGDFRHLGQRRFKGALGGFGGCMVEGLLQRVDFALGQNPLAQEAHLHLGQGVAQGVGLALGGGTIMLVVVGKCVRIGAHHVAVDKGRPKPGAAVGRSSLESEQAGLGIGAVHLSKVEVGEVGHQLGDVSAGRVHFDRDADGVAVVFHTENDRELLVGSGIERLPELSLGG